MTGSSAYDPRYSAITLGLLQDSGWCDAFFACRFRLFVCFGFGLLVVLADTFVFVSLHVRYKANFSNATPYEVSNFVSQHMRIDRCKQFGRGEGCDFVRPRCDKYEANDYGYFVSNAEHRLRCLSFNRSSNHNHPVIGHQFTSFVRWTGAYRCTPSQKGFWGCTCTNAPSLLFYTIFRFSLIASGGFFCRSKHVVSSPCSRTRRRSQAARHLQRRAVQRSAAALVPGIERTT